MSNQGIDTTSRSSSYLWLFGLIFSIFFTTIIWLLGPNLGHFVDTFLPDKGASWYYWQLPSRDSLVMVIAWALYLAHQFSIWAAIYFAYRNLHGFREVSWWGLPKYSLVALLGTGSRSSQTCSIPLSKKRIPEEPAFLTRSEEHTSELQSR